MEAWRKKYTWRFHLVMVLLMKEISVEKLFLTIRCADLRMPYMVLNNNFVLGLEGLLKLRYLWGTNKAKVTILLNQVVFNVLKNPNPLKDDEAFALLDAAVLVLALFWGSLNVVINPWIKSQSN